MTMTIFAQLPDPNLVHMLGMLDVLEAALIAVTQSVGADHPGLSQELDLPDPTAEQEAAAFLCSAADAVSAALRDYRLALLDACLF
jgi:hypothetical protein